MNTPTHSLPFRIALRVVMLTMAGALLPAYTAADVGLAWVQPTRGVSVALDAADNVYTVDYEQALGAEMSLTKRAANGTMLWVASFDQTSTTSWERASWVATDSAGNAIVCGTLMSGYSNPVEAASIVMKFNPNGAMAWRRVYESSFDGSSVRKCLVDGSDNVYVLGLGSGPNGRVTKVKKFAPDGTALWSFFDSAGIGAPLNFKLTPDGALLITGKSITGSYLGYSKIDLNGNLIWTYPAVFSMTAGDSAGDAFGNTYLVHGNATANGTIIKKLAASGALLWERGHGMAGFRVEVGNDNQAVVSGFPSTGTVGAAFIKVDTAGNLLWSNLDADGPLGLLAHAHMLIDKDNNAYLAAGTMSEMAVCRVNRDGSTGWTQTVAFGYAQAIALGNTDNSVYVVGGTTARLSQGDAQTLPTQPTVLSYFSLTETSIYLGWSDNSSNETGFRVERCTGTMLFCAANPGAWSLLTTTAANVSTFIDNGLAPGTTYVWRVQAFNDVGSSAYSNHLSVTTPGTVVVIPAAPSDLSASARRVNSKAEVRLGWIDNAGNETGFSVERCRGSSCTNFAAIATLPQNTVNYTDRGLSRKTTYHYRVKATGSGGNSPYSNIVSVRTP